MSANQQLQILLLVIEQLTGWTKDRLSRKQTPEACDVKRAAWWIMTRVMLPPMTTTAAGSVFYRDHTTVLHAQRKHGEFIQTNDRRYTPVYKQILEAFQMQIEDPAALEALADKKTQEAIQLRGRAMQLRAAQDAQQINKPLNI